MGILRRAVPRASVGTIVAICALGGMLHAQKASDSTCEPGGAPGHVYNVGKDGVNAPRIIHTADPEYSDKARRTKIQGAVLLVLTVDSNGDPTMISIVHGLGSGLDEKATEAVQQWKFEPGTIRGKPVAVAMCAQVEFHL